MSPSHQAMTHQESKGGDAGEWSMNIGNVPCDDENVLTVYTKAPPALES